MDSWLRNLIPAKWVATPKGPWSASNLGLKAIRRNEADLLVAALRLNGKAPVYFALFGAAGNFSRLEDDEGCQLAPGAALSVELDAVTTGTARCSVMVIEYDERGERIGAGRAKAAHRLLYPGTPDVARIVVCIRCSGKGEIRIDGARVSIDHDYYRTLARMRFPSSDDAVIAAVGVRSPSVVLPARTARNFVFPEVRAGQWQLEVCHRNVFIRENRRALVGRIALSGSKKSPALAESLGLAVCSNGHPFSYLGGGRGDAVFRQTMSFNLVEDQRALIARITVAADEELVLDSVLLISREEAARRARAGMKDEIEDRQSRRQAIFPALDSEIAIEAR